MTGSSTLYPFELFRLLEALWEQHFTRNVSLRALDETTTVYLDDGMVRYATTTGVTGTFPGYLLTEELFPRPLVHGWLKRCAREQRTLEDLLLAEGVLDASAIVALKADLGAATFASAFAISATVEVTPSRGVPPIFGALVLNPHDGLFQCTAEGLALPHLVSDVGTYPRRTLKRGPAFFRVWPMFRRWFDTTPLLSLLETEHPLASIISSPKEEARVLMHAFLMCETGMAYFAEASPRTGVMSMARAQRASTAPQAAPKAAARPEPPPRREPTQPGVTPSSVSVSAPPLTPPPPAIPEHRVTPPRAAVREVPWTDPSESFADLRGSLVGTELIEAADVARNQDCYEFFRVSAAAPLSEIRAAWQATRRRYENERYQGLMLRTTAATALRALQKRTEAAYDTLTDLRRRQDHDNRHGVETGLSRQMLEDVFYAEGLFKAAQIRLTDDQYTEAAEFLDEAFIRNPVESEYLSYLAFTIFTARIAQTNVGPVDEEPEELLERALAMNPKLESAWLFRARIEDHQGHPSRAMGAYLTVLDIHPNNDEARLAVRAFREAGILPAGRLRRRLAQRMGRLLTGRADP